ncbi:MAG: LptF/LptG family permease [Gemmatimonadales bacterium]
MKLISRHILRTLVAPFVWSLLALTGLLLLNQLGPLIDKFGGKGLDLSVMGEALVLAVPALMVLTIPMSVLTATLYAYSQLAGDLEMIAMYANGLSVWRMVRPALVGAFVLTVVNFFVFDQLVPISNSRFSRLRLDVSQKTPTLTFKPQVLNALPPNNPRFFLRASEIDQTTGGLTDVLIYDLTYEARRVIRADSGVMKQSSDQRDLLLTLYEGEIRDYRSVEPGRVERTAFLRDRIRIRDVANQLERSTASGADERSMTSCQLLDRVIEARTEYRDGQARREELTQRDLRSLTGLPGVGPAAVRIPVQMEADCGYYRAFGKWIERLLLPTPVQAQDPVGQDSGAPRTPMLPQDSGVRRQLPESSAVAESLRQLQQADSASRAAQAPPALLPGILDATEFAPAQDSSAFRFPMNQEPTPPDHGIVAPIVEVSAATMQAENALAIMRSHAVEYHKKFAIPLASFGFVLIGMALALKFPRGGIGLVIGGSLLIFMVFYVLLIGGEGLADKGYIPATVAMHGPVVLLTVVGILSVHSANQEMGSTRSVGILDSIRSFFRRESTT